MKQVTIPYRRIFRRLGPIGKMLLRRGYTVHIHLDGRLWKVWKIDSGWYVGEPA